MSISKTLILARQPCFSWPPEQRFLWYSDSQTCECMETLGLVPTALRGAQVMLCGWSWTTLWEPLEGIIRQFIRVLPFSRAYFSGAAIVSVCWVLWKRLSLASLPLATSERGEQGGGEKLSFKPAARNLGSNLWAFPQIPSLGFNSAPLAGCLEKWFSPKGKNNILFQKDILESQEALVALKSIL